MNRLASSSKAPAGGSFPLRAGAETRCPARPRSRARPQPLQTRRARQRDLLAPQRARSPANSADEQTLATDEYGPALITLDGKGNVYWASGSAPDVVKTVPITGGTKGTLASGQQGVTGIASDGKAVFWSTFDDAKV